MGTYIISRLYKLHQKKQNKELREVSRKSKRTIPARENSGHDEVCYCCLSKLRVEIQG